MLVRPFATAPAFATAQNRSTRDANASSQAGGRQVPEATDRAEAPATNTTVNQSLRGLADKSAFKEE